MVTSRSGSSDAGVTAVRLVLLTVIALWNHTAGIPASTARP
jgi:hypothetical protein